MNRAKRKLIKNIMTMPDDFSEEAIVLQLLLKEPPVPYGTVKDAREPSVSQRFDFKAHYQRSDNSKDKNVDIQTGK